MFHKALMTVGRPASDISNIFNSLFSLLHMSIDLHWKFIFQNSSTFYFLHFSILIFANFPKCCLYVAICKIVKFNQIQFASDKIQCFEHCQCNTIILQYLDFLPSIFEILHFDPATPAHRDKGTSFSDQKVLFSITNTRPNRHWLHYILI